MDEYSNQLAHFLLSAGFKHGDSLALFMENRLEYVGLWLGCTKIGVVPALINFNLRLGPLVHSVKAADPKLLMMGSGNIDTGNNIHLAQHHFSEISQFPISEV